MQALALQLQRDPSLAVAGEDDADPDRSAPSDPTDVGDYDNVDWWDGINGSILKTVVRAFRTARRNNRAANIPDLRFQLLRTLLAPRRKPRRPSP